MIATHEQALAILFESSVITITELSERIDTSYNTAENIVKSLVSAGILTENNSDQQDNKRYVFESYLKVLEEEY